MATSFITYYEKLELMQRWMVTDLTQAQIQGYANFLVAMGIFNYLETLGSFYTRGKNYQKFKSVFYDLLPNGSNQYKDFYDQLEKLTKYGNNQGGAYDCLRCGLTHEYLVKTYPKNNKVAVKLGFTVYGADKPALFNMNIASRNCGLEIIKLQAKVYHLRIYNPRMIHDLNLAFEKLKEKIRNNNVAKSTFLYRAREVGLENLS
jgi:hypothetical protein